MKSLKQYIIIIVLALAIGAVHKLQNHPKSEKNRTAKSSIAKKGNTSAAITNTSLKNAYRNRKSNIQISGCGIVKKVLKDDLKGSRHQRFILKVNPNQTILIAHNIDIAPRISNLHQGARVSFCGEYEWNTKGGVVHWTHHDPNRRHSSGWLKHNGRTYQ
jgi:hypothetical protein